MLVEIGKKIVDGGLAGLGAIGSTFIVTQILENFIGIKSVSEKYLALQGLDIDFGIDIETLQKIRSACNSKEGLLQIQKYLPEKDRMSLEKVNWLAKQIDSRNWNRRVDSTLYPPFLEEFEYRFLLQDVLLTRYPKWLMRKISPGSETILDSKVAQIVRVTLTAAAFAYGHTVDPSIVEDLTGEDVTKFYVYSAQATHLAASSFLGGLIFGALYETEAGLLGSTVAHMAYNSHILVQMLWEVC